MVSNAVSNTVFISQSKANIHREIYSYIRYIMIIMKLIHTMQRGPNLTSVNPKISLPSRVGSGVPHSPAFGHPEDVHAAETSRVRGFKSSPARQQALACTRK